MIWELCGVRSGESTRPLPLTDCNTDKATVYANSEHSNDASFEVNLGATCEDLNEAGDNEKNINDED